MLWCGMRLTKKKKKARADLPQLSSISYLELNQYDFQIGEPQLGAPQAR